MQTSYVAVTSGLLTDMVGRDKIMRTCSFTAGFLASLSGGVTSQKLRTIQGQISSCRVVFRLFGDFPSWIRAKRYKFGKDTVVDECKNPLTETVSVLNVFADLIYLPVEHIAWAAQNNLIPVSAGRWWTASIVVWAVSLVLAVVKSVNNLNGLVTKIQRLSKRADEDSVVELSRLKRRAVAERLNIIRCSADLMMAVNGLPRGFLWAQKLSPRIHCMFGIVASLSGLLQVKNDLFPGRRLRD